MTFTRIPATNSILAEELTPEMLGKLAAVRPALDLIVVEASGVAEPPAVARTIMTADSGDFHYAGLVLVVNATEPEFGHGLPIADLVVLNYATEADVDDVLAGIRAQNPRVPVVPTDFARIDPTLLVDVPERAPQAQLSFDELLHDDHDHEHPVYQTVEYTTDAVLNPRRLLALLRDRPEGLYRAKGFVDFGAGHRYLLQLVGGSLRLQKRRGSGTQLVCIGTGMDTDTVHAALHECTTEPADENAILGVHKYVV